MRHLIKLILIIGAILTSIMVILKVTGVLTVEQIRVTLEAAEQISPLYVSLISILLLSADLLITVPTMTVSLLTGYFTGFVQGVLTVIIGLMIAGNAGYFLSRRYGKKILPKLIRKKKDRLEAKQAFRKHGFIMIMLSRAVPVLPEATACLAGMTGMSYRRFLLAWSINTIPYALIVVWAGSVSSISNPFPGVLTAIGVTGIFWMAWYVFHRQTRKQEQQVP